MAVRGFLHRLSGCVGTALCIRICSSDEDANAHMLSTISDIELALSRWSWSRDDSSVLINWIADEVHLRGVLVVLCLDNR